MTTGGSQLPCKVTHLHDTEVLVVFLCTQNRPSGERRGHLPCSEAAVRFWEEQLPKKRALHPNKYMLEYLESDAAKTLPKHLEGTASMLG